MKGLLTFLGGALLGASVTYVLTSDDCRDLRRKVRNYLRKKGLVESTDLDELVDLIAIQISNDKENNETEK